MSVAGCANCGAARRSDGLMFCSSCGLPYPAGSAVPVRRPPVLGHPWFLFFVVIAVAGVAVILLAPDVTVRLGTETGGRALAIGLWILACAVYWAPTLTAIARRRMTVWTVALVNLFFGVIVIGWIVAFWLGTGGRTYEQMPDGTTDSARSP